jgi:hypothetical protein
LVLRAADGCLDEFRQHRLQSEPAARDKYLKRPIDAVGEVRLGIEDLEFTKFAR